MIVPKLKLGNKVPVGTPGPCPILCCIGLHTSYHFSFSATCWIEATDTHFPDPDASTTGSFRYLHSADGLGFGGATNRGIVLILLAEW